MVALDPTRVITRHICTFLCLFSWTWAGASEIPNIGVPYVENFSKSEYLAGNQNWSVGMDERNVLYFGNSKGLLSFDRNLWKLHAMPQRQIVRSVATDKKGRIYTGAFGELGYWEYNKNAVLEYHSLTKLLPKGFELNDEIWKIYIDKDRVIFHAFGSILIYQNGKFQLIREGPYLFMIQAGDRYFVEVLKKGLFELKGNRLVFIPGSEEIGNTSVLSILQDGQDSFVIGTANHGLYKFDKGLIRPWNIPAGDFLKAYQLNNGVALFGKYFAFGTIRNGILIIDRNGRTIQHINKSSGLQNNTVLSLFADASHNLWAGLDNGIDRIELNSPLSFFFDRGGELGTVYSSIIHKNTIYLGTNQGLYSSSWNPGKGRQIFDFELIPNTQGQVWELANIDGELFCGHNSGTFKVADSRIEKISAVNGGWTIKKMVLEPEVLIQGTYTGLVIYKRQGSGYVFSHKVAGFSEPSRYVEQDERGNIWVSHAYKGLYRLNLSPDLRSVQRLKKYSGSSGLPSDYNVNIFNLNGRILFSTRLGFYIYDEISDRFKSYSELNNMLGTFAASNKIIPAGRSKYWFIEHGKVAMVNFEEPGKISIDSTLFSVLNGRMVQDYENISTIHQNLHLISIDDGFSLYHPDAKRTRYPLPGVLIGQLENITAHTQVISEMASLAESVKIRYKNNDIRISYSLPYYRQAKITYQYMLDGYSGNWSAWSESPQKDFTNLPYGKYTFKVRARLNDTVVSEISSFSFEVMPPLAASPGAWLLYLVLLATGIYFVRQWYARKLKRHKLKIEAQLQSERDEHLRQEALLNEQKLIKLKTEKLQAELESKSREVTNSAMNIVYKNEFLQRINQELNSLKDADGRKLDSEQLKRIQKIISEGMNDERDWNLFERSFNETHENFFKKLKAKHPELVPNDLKLCAYLRMNMNSKEMASLLNISLRGVEIRRYRLRKKLDIPHDKNLVEFLIEL